MGKPKKEKAYRILVLLDQGLLPPSSTEGLKEEEIQPFKMELDVISTLTAMGHEVLALEVFDDLASIRESIKEFKPHIAFNLFEQFHGISLFDQHLVSYLELLKVPYTGCNPRGLTLARDKSLCKKILAFHRVRVPNFAVFPFGRTRLKKPEKLRYPLIVKSLTEEGSVGISKASLVHNPEELFDRVAFIHKHTSTDAIAEEFIDGRELYVGVMGNKRLNCFPIWELEIKNLAEGEPKIATGKVKWDYKYQTKMGVVTGPARDLSKELVRKIENSSKKIFKLLHLSGYARLDFRLNGENQLYLLEANPNPNLCYGEDFAESAELKGLDYPDLLSKIIQLGLDYKKSMTY